MSRTKGQRAYEMRASGQTWVQVAEAVGYSTDSNAMKAAKRYADLTNEKWPISVRVSGSIGQRAYECRQATGASWGDVAEKVGAKNAPAALAGANHWARRKGLDWPIPAPAENLVALPDRRLDSVIEAITAIRAAIGDPACPLDQIADKVRQLRTGRTTEFERARSIGRELRGLQSNYDRLKSRYDADVASLKSEIESLRAEAENYKRWNAKQSEVIQARAKASHAGPSTVADRIVQVLTTTLKCPEGMDRDQHALVALGMLFGQVRND